jgi:hypothetical protein
LLSTGLISTKCTMKGNDNLGHIMWRSLILTVTGSTNIVLSIMLFDQSANHHILPIIKYDHLCYVIVLFKVN